jgi:tetratricopeptide (TPR) repeat protein
VTSRVDDGHRRLVPRWRYSNRVIVGFEQSGDPRDGSRMRPMFASIDPIVLAWRIEPSYVSASDLLSAAVVAARPELAVAPSEWLLSRGFSIPADVKETAQRILTPADLELPERLPEQPLEVGTQDARAVIALNRQLLAAYPRSASRWTDLSLAHSVLGNRDKALRAMQTALSIEPNNRVVLRAAIRLLIHLGKAEEALELLQRHPRTRSDPWLLSQDISVANIVGEDPYFLKQSRRLLRDETLPAGHLTELASAVATFDGGTADLKYARKLHRLSLIAPTDNVLAQIEWLRQRDPSLPQAMSASTRGAMEANFWRTLVAGEWEPALNAVYQWQNDEPYSTRPAMAGSFLLSSILSDYKGAEKFAKFGLRADPGDPLLMNNLVVAKARQYDLFGAASIFKKIRPDDRLNTFTYKATQGLMKYAAGDELGGAEDYEDSLRLASGSEAALMVRASWLDTQARWAKAVDQALVQRVKADAAVPGRVVARGIALTALNLVKAHEDRPLSPPGRSALVDL